MEFIQEKTYLKLRTEIKSTLNLAIPLILTQFAETAIAFVDLIMMGWLGTEILAAGGLGAITFAALIYISAGLFYGLGAIAAVAFTQKNIEKIRTLLIQGLWIGFIFAVPIALLLWHFGSILTLLGQEERIAHYAEIYLRAIVWGLPATLGFIAIKEVANACDRPQFLTIIAAIAVPINGLANYTFMFGHFGFPALGLAGAGWSSTFVFWLMFLSGIGYLQFHPDFREYRFFDRLWFSDRSTFWEILKLGIPIGIQLGSEFGIFAFIALLMGYLGTENLAAHEITVSVLDIAILIPIGFSHATAIRVAQQRGNHNLEGIKTTFLVVFLLNIAIASLISLALWMFAPQIIAIYLDPSNLDNIEATNIALSLLKIATFIQVIYGLHFLAIGALQGLQDTLIPMWINISIYWVIGLGGSYFIAIILHQGAIGVWLALMLAIISSTGILIWRFSQILPKQKENW